MIKAVIFGCSGQQLTPTEREFFKTHQPLGFILFARNIHTPEQTKALVNDLKSCVNHSDVPILIDQEGGRVARLKAPHWRHPQAASFFGDLYAQNPEWALKATYLNHRLMAHDLYDLGITVDCAPMIDVHTPKADNIIGDRSFSADPSVVAALGEAAIRGLADGGVTAIIKHIPGHGLATCDSHEMLPQVTASRSELSPHFEPFMHNYLAPWAMTAHILYTAIDPQNVATESKIVIQEIIRKQIGFEGFLVSDDLGMKALSGSWAQKTQRSLAAGCDAVLHCSGVMDEMISVAEAAGELSSHAQRRLEQQTTLSAQKIPLPFDHVEALAFLGSLKLEKAA